MLEFTSYKLTIITIKLYILIDTYPLIIIKL